MGAGSGAEGPSFASKVVDDRFDARARVTGRYAELLAQPTVVDQVVGGVRLVARLLVERDLSVRNLFAHEICEFPEAHRRATASGFSYNVAQIIGGAIPPLVATPIIAARGSAFFGLCLAALVVVSLICVSLLRETRGAQLHARDS